MLLFSQRLALPIACFTRSIVPLTIHPILLDELGREIFHFFFRRSSTALNSLIVQSRYGLALLMSSVAM